MNIFSKYDKRYTPEEKKLILEKQKNSKTLQYWLLIIPILLLIVGGILIYISFRFLKGDDDFNFIFGFGFCFILAGSISLIGMIKEWNTVW